MLHMPLEVCAGWYYCVGKCQQRRNGGICACFGQTRNAVKLLAYMKFPAEIVDMAEKLSGDR